MTPGWNERISRSVPANPQRPAFQLTGNSTILPKRAIFSGSPSATVLESFPPGCSATGLSFPAADSEKGFSMYVPYRKLEPGVLNSIVRRLVE